MIKRIISLLKKNTEFILYAFFGVITALISFSVFYLCNMLFGNDFYLLNNAVAWFCAVTFACFTNKFFVFKSESLEPKVIIREIVVFYSSRIMTLAIEEIGLWLLVEGLNMKQLCFVIFAFEITGHLISKGIVGIISVTINYLFSKFITFAKKSKNTDS